MYIPEYMQKPLGLWLSRCKNYHSYRSCDTNICKQQLSFLRQYGDSSIGVSFLKVSSIGDQTPASKSPRKLRQITT